LHWRREDQYNGPEMMRTTILLVTLLTVFALAAPGMAAPKAPDVLGGRYRSIFHGFSLCPPAGTERVRQTSRRRLVAWVKRDGPTGAIRW